MQILEDYTQLFVRSRVLLKKIAMKRFLVLVLGSLLLQFQCSEDEITEPVSLFGTWQLEAVLADPGDGSGTFQNVDSEKNIVFNTDSTFTSNGLGCVVFGDNTTSPASGTFNNNRLFIEDCDMPVFFFVEEDRMFLNNFGCFEECSERYFPVN